jgi:valyl-tRNA synthetase
MFFWSARMVMFGVYNMRYLGPEDSVPFRNLLFHGLIRDPKGEKMTKSRGNVVDPLIAASQYGADAFRFGLMTSGTLGQDMKFSDEKLSSARNFANKLWNSTRYVLLKAGDRTVERPRPGDDLAIEDRWILSQLAALEADVDSLLRAYQLGEAGRRVQDFLWNEFCDWYIEMSKVRLNAGDERPMGVLVDVLDRGLRLLHPFMPFVTEELWQSLRRHIAGEQPDMLIIAPYPRPNEGWRDAEADAAIGHVIDVNRAVRNIRAEKGIPVGDRPLAYLRAAEYGDALRETAEATAFTSRVEPRVTGADEPLPGGEYAFARVGTTEIAVALPEVDTAAERERLQKELEEAEAYIKRLDGQLSNQQFLGKAPEHVVQGMRDRHAEATARAEGLRDRLAKL